MMMLELDYMSSFNDPYFDDNSSTLPYSTLAILFLLIFVLLMPILLVNLLIGLAVGDIESVLRNATLKRLAMQVEHHTELERRLPSKLLEKVDKMKSRVFKNLLQTESEGFSICGGEEASYLKTELLKQKTRLKEMSLNMESNYDMLKLIVQKMEIETEADNQDEGFQTSQSLDVINPSSMWNSDALKKNLIRQNAVISK